MSEEKGLLRVQTAMKRHKTRAVEQQTRFWQEHTRPEFLQLCYFFANLHDRERMMTIFYKTERRHEGLARVHFFAMLLA